MVKKESKLKYIIGTIIFSTCFLLFLGVVWVTNSFGLVSVDELIYHIRTSLSGSSKEVIVNCIISILIPFLFFLIGIIFFIYFIKKGKWNVDVSLKIKIFNKHFKIELFPNIIFVLERFYILFSIIFGVMFIAISCIKINLFDYINNLVEDNPFIKDNYVDPSKVELTFPNEKKNLIYIYVESLENTFFSNQVGGYSNVELMPELYDLSQNNTSFSNGNMMGGFYTVGATTWTIGALVAQTAGVPLKVPLDLNPYGKEGDFLLGGYSLGEILDEQGYNQTFLIGSNATFGGRRAYFSKHGNYNIYDYYSAIEKGKISEDYFVWWGYEDKKLYSNAKEELSRLASLDEPFNLTMLTTETHHPNGYFDSSICENKYDDQFMNSISCASQQLASFVKWIQKQDFYSNTTIVIAGDHLSMNTDYFKDIDDYERTVFNLFINSSVSTDNTKNRLFSSMDMYPTTLASLGVEIDGNKLGLGTNLFSNEQTLLEKYGVDEVNDLLNKKSTFYNNNILYSN